MHEKAIPLQKDSSKMYIDQRYQYLLV